MANQLCQNGTEVAAVCPCSCCHLTPSPTLSPTIAAPTTSPTIPICPCPVDVVFLLDGSASITEARFRYEVLSFVEQIINRLDVDGPANSRVAIATFGSLGGANFVMPLNNTLTKSELRELVPAVPYPGGLTFVKTALTDARLHFARHDRAPLPVTKVLVTVLDGAFTAGIFVGNGTTFVDFTDFLEEANAIRVAGIHSYSVLLPLMGEVYDPFTREPLSTQQRTKSALILSTDPSIATKRYFFDATGTAGHGTNNVTQLVGQVGNRICTNAQDDGECDITADQAP